MIEIKRFDFPKNDLEELKIMIDMRRKVFIEEYNFSEKYYTPEKE